MIFPILINDINISLARSQERSEMLRSRRVCRTVLGVGRAQVLPPTVSTNLTFPVRRLDQTLEAWRESQISSGMGEFDLRIYALNFALHSPTRALLCSPQETQVLGEGSSVSKLHHLHHHTQSHCHLQKSALRNVSQGVCSQKP